LDEGAATAVPSARWNPTWWVILAVALALMALLVATSGGTGNGHKAARVTQAADRNTPRTPHSHVALPLAPTTTTSSMRTITVVPETSTSARSSGLHGYPASGTDEASTSVLARKSSPPSSHAASSTTTTTMAATTTTATTQLPSGSSERTQTQGYLDPPLEASNQFGFTGAGKMTVSVVWSGDTHLAMSVICPSGGHDVGGTSSMEASVPNASGNCTATVTEPSSESVSLTYTISWGPAGG
jgi:hypothetical protein